VKEILEEQIARDLAQGKAMNSNNPVIDVYNQLRTARLNVKYHEAKLRRWRRSNFWMELLIAISASSTAASAWFFQGTFGACLWKILTGVTAILAIAKPMLKLPDKIHRADELLAGYRMLDFDLERLTISIREKKCYNEEHKRQFSTALDRKRELLEEQKESEPDEKLLNQCYEKVLRELPAEEFYMPEESKI
jgi:hypothetical protein